MGGGGFSWAHLGAAAALGIGVAFALRVSRGGRPGRARAKASGDSDDDSREEVLQDVTCAIGGTPVVRLDRRGGYGRIAYIRPRPCWQSLSFKTRGGRSKTESLCV